MLSASDINSIMFFVRSLEEDTVEHNLVELFDHIREENKQLKGEHLI